MPDSVDSSRHRPVEADTKGYPIPPAPPSMPTPPQQPLSQMGSLFTRILGTLGRFFISTGVIILLFVAYQLWGTGIQEAQAQDGLRSDFETVLQEATVLVPEFEAASTPTATTIAAEPAPAIEGSVDVPDKIEAPTSTTTSIPKEFLEFLFPEGGEEVARLQIPAIEVDKIVVEGVQVSDLRKGPGRYSSTALPGESGNAAIAGHRTTYGAPFHNIDQLLPGDEIVVTNVLGRFVYEVIGQAETDRIGFCDGFVPGEQTGDSIDESGLAGHFIVDPRDTCVLDDWGDNRLTLTACHPKFSARQRIVVTARLVGSPVDAPDRPEPVVEQEPSAELGAGESTPTSAIAVADPGTTIARSETSQNVAAVAVVEDLDEGLGWDTTALPAAVYWGIAALLMWVLASYAARNWRRWPSYALALLPFAFLLFRSFEQIDRLLPAY